VTRSQGWLPSRLPMGMRDDTVLVRFLQLLETVVEPLQQRIDQLPHLSDATVTPVPMLPWLAAMLGADDLETLPELTRRRYIQDAGVLMQLRGTKAQLEALVAPFCSGSFSVTDDGGIYREGEADPCHGNVVVAMAGLQHTSRENLAAMIREAVPAHCVAWLQIGEEPMEALVR
jgi:phage tail-like protein